MNRARQLAVSLACALFALGLAPLSLQASCFPNVQITFPEGYYIKWYPAQPYASQQDRKLRFYSAVPSISSSTLRTQTLTAYQKWDQGAGFTAPDFTTELAALPPSLPPTTADPTSVTLFLTHADFLATGAPNDGTIGYTNIHNYPNGNIINGQIYIDGSEPYSLSCANGACETTKFSLLGTTVHEFGHLLGLDHPAAPSGTCQTQTVMEVISQRGSTSKESLYSTDGQRITFLYAGFPVSAGLSFSAHGSGDQDTLLWAETTSRYCTYRIFASSSCMGPYAPVATVIGVTAQSEYSLVVPATYSRNYHYRLIVDVDGARVDSARAVSEHTGGAPMLPVGIPTALSGDGSVSGRITLGWQPSSGTVDGYYLYRNVNSLPDCADGDVFLGSTTGTSFVDTSVEPGFTYAYRIQAYNSSGSSPSSAEALAFSVYPDLVAPATVSSLSLQSRCTSIEASWIAPGDDGTTGIAHHYDLRMSTSPITNTSFSNAQPVPTAPPGQPGTWESTVIDVGACSGGRYFALKTYDEAGNVSALSNVAQGSTPCFEFCEDSFAPMPVRETRFALSNPTPNPAGSVTQVECGIPPRLAGLEIKLVAFDLLGRPIRSILLSSEAQAGRKTASWDLRDDRDRPVQNGVYFLRLSVGAETVQRSVLVIR